MKTIFTLLFITISIQLLNAQTPVEKKLGAWYTVDGTHTLSDKISLTTGVQLRDYEVFDDINLIFFYAGINYKLTPKTTLSAGYYYIDVDKTFIIHDTPHLYENTIFEQIAYNHNLGKLPIYHKLRLENRFFSYSSKTFTEHRFRYCLGSKIKINDLLFINANNEFFANLQGDVFDENRLYGALGFNLSKSNNIQFGYMNQKIKGLNLHRLQVMLLIKTDLRKKQKTI